MGLAIWSAVQSACSSPRATAFSRSGAGTADSSPTGRAPGNTAVFRKRADGTGSAELLMRGRQSLRLEDWSPDGRSLLFSEYTSRGDTDVWIYSDGKARPLLVQSVQRGVGEVFSRWPIHRVRGRRRRCQPRLRAAVSRGRPSDRYLRGGRGLALYGSTAGGSCF